MLSQKHFSAWVTAVCALGCGAFIAMMIVSACAHSQNIEPVCRHHALYAAVAWGDMTEDDVKIALGKTGVIRDKKTGDVWWHAQAMAKVDGRWVWLKVDNYNIVYIGEQERFEPDRYMSALEFFIWITRDNPVLRKPFL